MKPNGNGRVKPRPIPEVLTPDEQARLLAQIDLEAPSGNRNLALIRLMINTGLRAAEVRDLRHRHIDWKSGRMKIRGKGGCSTRNSVAGAPSRETERIAFQKAK